MSLLAQAVQSGADGGTAEAVLFWTLGPVALASAIAMVCSRKVVHAVLWLVLTFFCLAVFYAAQDAPFLAVVQITVYAGAIMVLFLFVIMLIGVDRSDSLVETIRGQRVAALLAGLAFVAVLVGGMASTLLDLPNAGLGQANAQGNVRGIAQLLFEKYVFAFEATSALLIVAAIGAMVLAHRERATPPVSQRNQSRNRFAGRFPTPGPIEPERDAE